MNKKLIYLLTVSLAFGSSEMKLASNPTTPIEILVSLSKESDEDVRVAVAGNPNTPSEVLIELCKDKEEDVVIKAIENKHTPMSVILPLVNHEEDEIRSAIARNPKLSSKSMEILATDSDDSVREALASNVNLDEKILRLLSNDKEEDVVKAVIANPKTPSDILEKFVNNEDYQIFIAGNSNTNPTILDSFIDPKYPIALRMKVAKNASLSLSSMEKIVHSNEHDAMFIKAALARNPKATETILSKLSECNDFSFTRAATLIGVASNKNTSPEVLDRLGKDENLIVRAFVYKNPKTPESRLAILKGDPDFNKFDKFDEKMFIFRGELTVNLASHTRDTFVLLGRPDIARALDIIHVEP